jgi:hypothetical protein
MSPLPPLGFKQFVAASTTSYESISTVTVGSGGASSITFSSIPSTYKHLQVRGISRDSRSQTSNNIYFKLNGDSGGNYTYHWLDGNGTSATAGGSGAQTIAFAGYSAASTATASVMGATVIDILDYQNTNKYKTVRSLSGTDNNGNGIIALLSSLWLDTTAVNSIELYPRSSATFSQYSSFALYGIKG